MTQSCNSIFLSFRSNKSTMRQKTEFPPTENQKRWDLFQDRLLVNSRGNHSSHPIVSFLKLCLQLPCQLAASRQLLGKIFTPVQLCPPPSPELEHDGSFLLLRSVQSPLLPPEGSFHPSFSSALLFSGPWSQQVSVAPTSQNR